ncbi:MAG: DUF4240 domain-containing protein [Myxococcales bacterium]|nr:DUF4240 domain-containing protein [Myxococcales bacterium]
MKTLSEVDFWRVIEDVRRSTAKACISNYTARADALRRKLTPMGTSKIHAFWLTYQQLMSRCDTPELRRVVGEVAGMCSDDWFWYFRNWLISMGRSDFDAVCKDPARLSRYASRPDVPDLFFEGFDAAISDAYTAAGGGELT